MPGDYVRKVGLAEDLRATKRSPSHRDKFILSLRKRRQRLNLSQRTLARKIGVNPLTLYQWEHKRNNPPWPGLEAWVNALGGRVEVKWDEGRE